MLGLGVLLWRAGGLKMPPANVAATPAWKKPMVPMPLDLNAIVAEAKSMPPPAVEPLPPPIEPPPSKGSAPLIFGPPAVTPRPPVVALPEVMGPPAAPPHSTGSADRLMTVPVHGPHLAMPLAGIDAKSLRDTFSDKRDGRQHAALDIMAPRNTPVLAVAEGNVAKLFTSKQGGLTVYQFDNTGTYCYYYAHLDHYAPGLKEGTLLRKGEVLGYVGSTGNASPTAPHLHLAVFQLKPDKKWWDGTPIDPLPLLQ
jgi:murein DD-endopeptidase MepM/ murein hydrolase activator NlpD